MRCTVHKEEGTQDFDVTLNPNNSGPDVKKPADQKSSTPDLTQGRGGWFSGLRSRFRRPQLKTKIGGGRTKVRLKNKHRSRKYKKTASHRKKSSRRRDIRRSLRRIN